MPNYLKKIRTTNDSVERRLVGSVIPVSPESFGMTAGAALTEGMIVFKSTETGNSANKIYPISNTTKYIDLNYGLAVVKKACSSGNILNGDYIAQQGVYTYASAVAGRAYGLAVVYDGTGYKINTGTPVDINGVTDGIIIYMGIGEISGSDKIIACDFSNHVFFEVEGSRITAINGRKISANGSNVPVSVDAQMPPAGEALNNSLVFKCVSDNKLYAINSASRLNKPVDLDWGIALCKPNIAANAIPENNKVVQKAEIDYLSTLLENGSTTADGDDLYFYCSIGNHPTPRGMGGSNIYSTGHIGNYTDVKSWATNYGGCVYMYVGTCASRTENNTTTLLLILDTSNHVFFTIDGAANITEINGVPIYQVSIPAPDYRNPVSGDSLMPLAYNAIAVGSLVFKGTDGKLRAVSSTNSKELVDPDWGLAIYRGNSALAADDRPANNTLIQQCQWGGGGADLTSFTAGDQIYAIFLPTYRDNNGISYPSIWSGLTLTNRAGLVTTAAGYHLTYCYIGTLIVNGGSRYIAVDLSAHQFITEDFSTNKITDINGVAVGGTSSAGETAVNSVSYLNSLRCTRYFYINKITSPVQGVYRTWFNLNIYNFKSYPIEVYLYNYGIFVDPETSQQTIINNPTDKKIINIPPYTCYHGYLESIVRISDTSITAHPTYVLGYGYGFKVSSYKHIILLGDVPTQHITVDIPQSISIGASNYYVRDELQDMVISSTQYYGWTKYNDKNNHVWTTQIPEVTAYGIGTVYYYNKTGTQLGAIDFARYETKNMYERYQNGDYIDPVKEVKFFAWKCLTLSGVSGDTYGLYDFQHLIYTDTETPSPSQSTYVSGQQRHTVYQNAYDNYGNYLCGKVLEYTEEPNNIKYSSFGVFRIGNYDANTNAGGLVGQGYDSVVDIWDNRENI